MWLSALPVEDAAVAVSLMLSVAPVASEAIVISENGTLMFVVLGALQQDQPELPLPGSGHAELSSHCMLLEYAQDETTGTMPAPIATLIFARVFATVTEPACTPFFSIEKETDCVPWDSVVIMSVRVPVLSTGNAVDTEYGCSVLMV